jgi:hypothetical protein
MTTKVADFDALPEATPRWLLRANPTDKRSGRAVFRKFDDGWRVESIVLMADVEFDIDWDGVPGVLEDRQRRAAEQAAEAARQERFRVADTPSRTIATLDSQKGICLGSPSGDSTFSRLTVTDADVTVELWSWGRADVRRTYPYRMFPPTPEVRAHPSWRDCSMLVVDLGAEPGYELSRGAAFVAPSRDVEKAREQVSEALRLWREKHRDLGP